MTEILLGVVVVCLLAVIGLQVALLLRKVGVDLSPLQHTLDGIAKNRSEASAAARQSREELSNSLKAVADTLAKRFDALTQATSATLNRREPTGLPRMGNIEATRTGTGGRTSEGILPWRIPHRRLYFHAHHAADKMKSMGRMRQARQSPWMIWRLAVPGQERCSSDSTHNGRRTGWHLSTKELP